MVNPTYHLLLPSAPRTGAATSDPIETKGARGIILYLHLSAYSGTGGLTVQLRFKNLLTGNSKIAWQIPVSLKAEDTVLFVHYPGAREENTTTQYVVSLPLAQVIDVTVSPDDGSSQIYSLVGELIP